MIPKVHLLYCKLHAVASTHIWSLIIIIINEYPEAGLMASISVQHIHHKQESQQKNFTNTIITFALSAKTFYY